MRDESDYKCLFDFVRLVGTVSVISSSTHLYLVNSQNTYLFTPNIRFNKIQKSTAIYHKAVRCL